jgi:hypothetical protein
VCLRTITPHPIFVGGQGPELPSKLDIGYDHESAAWMQTGCLEKMLEGILTLVGTMLANALGGRAHPKSKPRGEHGPGGRWNTIYPPPLSAGMKWISLVGCTC